MSYRVDRTDPNNPPINVDMSTTKKQLGLTWVGQYYSRYGEVQSENFLKLLENFASEVEPNSTDDSGLALRNVLGQLWYNTQDVGNGLGKSLKIYNDNRFNSTGGWKRLEPIISNAEPTVHAEGEIWYQPSTNTFKMSRGTRWEEITVQLAEDSKKLGGLLPDQFIRSDVDDTVYGVLRTNEIFPDRHREYDLGKPSNRWESIYGVTLDINNSHSLMPEFTDSYDVGDTNLRWRNGYFSLVDSINFTNISPLANNTYNLGNNTKYWNNAYITTLNVEKVSSFEPIDSTRTIGKPSVRWNTAYLDVLDTNTTYSLIPDINGIFPNQGYDLGSDTSKWRSIYVDVIKGSTKTETLYPRLDNTYDLGTPSQNYRNAYINNFPNSVNFNGDIDFDIVINGKSNGIVWTGLTDTHSIYVEETTNSETTRLVLENRDNVNDYTSFVGYHGEIARFKSTEVEVVAGVLKTKGTLKVEDTNNSSGCEMVYNDTNETLDFIFY